MRHLVGKLFAGCLHTLGCESDAEEYDTVDGINALVVCLEKLFRKRSEEKVVVVLDSIDDMKATSTGLGTMLLPALARLGDVVSVGSLRYLDCRAERMTDTASFDYTHNSLFQSTSLAQDRSPLHPFSSLYSRRGNTHPR